MAYKCGNKGCNIPVTTEESIYSVRMYGLCPLHRRGKELKKELLEINTGLCGEEEALVFKMIYAN